MAASASSAADPAAAAAIAFATALPSRLAPTPCTARLLSLFNNPALPPSALAPVSTVLLPTLVKGTSNAAAYATVLSKLASAGLPTPPMAQQPLLDKTGGGAALSSALAVLTEQAATHEVGRKEKRAGGRVRSRLRRGGTARRPRALRRRRRPVCASDAFEKVCRLARRPRAGASELA